MANQTKCRWHTYGKKDELGYNKCLNVTLTLTLGSAKKLSRVLHSYIARLLYKICMTSARILPVCGITQVRYRHHCYDVTSWCKNSGSACIIPKGHREDCYRYVTIILTGNLTYSCSEDKCARMINNRDGIATTYFFQLAQYWKKEN